LVKFCRTQFSLLWLGGNDHANTMTIIWTQTRNSSVASL
jgi:hypothetical protein